MGSHVDDEVHPDRYVEEEVAMEKPPTWKEIEKQISLQLGEVRSGAEDNRSWHQDQDCTFCSKTKTDCKTKML